MSQTNIIPKVAAKLIEINNRLSGLTGLHGGKYSLAIQYGTGSKGKCGLLSVSVDLVTGEKRSDRFKIFESEQKLLEYIEGFNDGLMFVGFDPF